MLIRKIQLKGVNTTSSYPFRNTDANNLITMINNDTVVSDNRLCNISDCLATTATYVNNRVFMKSATTYRPTQPSIATINNFSDAYWTTTDSNSKIIYYGTTINQFRNVSSYYNNFSAYGKITDSILNTHNKISLMFQNNWTGFTYTNQPQTAIFNNDVTSVGQMSLVYPAFKYFVEFNLTYKALNLPAGELVATLSSSTTGTVYCEQRITTDTSTCVYNFYMTKLIDFGALGQTTIMPTIQFVSSSSASSVIGINTNFSFQVIRAW